MSLLRSSIIIALLSFLLLGGYGGQLLGECCKHACASATTGAPAKKSPHDQQHHDGCQCNCHHAFAPIPFVPLSSAHLVLAETDIAQVTDVYPPDSLPLGIEYPPQLS